MGVSVSVGRSVSVSIGVSVSVRVSAQGNQICMNLVYSVKEGYFEHQRLTVHPVGTIILRS